MKHKTYLGITTFLILCVVVGATLHQGHVLNKQLKDNLVQSYIQLHYKRYPFCEEHEAVLMDAVRDTEWYLANQKYMAKTFWKKLDSANKEQIINSNSELWRYYQKVIQERPKPPKPTHTHETSQLSE